MLTSAVLALLLIAPSAAPGPIVVHQGGKRVTRSLTDGAETRSLLDMQAGVTRTVTGVPLDRLVRAPSGQLIVLRFDNGVIVPVQAAHAGEVFIATSWTRADGVVEKTFPPVPRAPEFNLDPRPVTFAHNKAVVSKGNAGGLPAPVGHGFTPWSRTSSLVEARVMSPRAFVDRIAPKKAPAEGATAARTGQDLFVRRCVYCHGVNDVGASFGTDVLVGVPLADRYTVESLQAQVATHKLDDYQAGLMMPPQHDLTRAEARQLHTFFRALKAAPPTR